MNSLPWPVLPKRRWPSPSFREKRAITPEEHELIIAREPNPEWKAYFRLLWHAGGAQSDVALLRAEDVDWQAHVNVIHSPVIPRLCSVHIFWDNSNIYIPSQFVANKREGGRAGKDIRIYFRNLYSLARAGRPVQRAVCTVSVPPERQQIWQRLEAAGVTPELYERGAGSGSEQGVDQCLQVHMLRALSDFDPGVVVLLTGDGAGYETGTGFHSDLERMHDAGWGIEVVSWDCACNRRLKAWAQQVGAYIDLERYYESVTFRKGLRYAKPLNMTHRPTSRPRL